MWLYDKEFDTLNNLDRFWEVRAGADGIFARGDGEEDIRILVCTNLTVARQELYKIKTALKNGDKILETESTPME